MCYLSGPSRHWSLQSWFHTPTTASGTISLHTNNIHLDIFWCPAPYAWVSWGPDHTSVCPLRSRHTHHMSSVLPLNIYVLCGPGPRIQWPAQHLQLNDTNKGISYAASPKLLFLPNLTTSVVYLRKKNISRHSSLDLRKMIFKGRSLRHIRHHCILQTLHSIIMKFYWLTSKVCF